MSDSPSDAHSESKHKAKRDGSPGGAGASNGDSDAKGKQRSDRSDDKEKSSKSDRTRDRDRSDRDSDRSDRDRGRSDKGRSDRSDRDRDRSDRDRSDRDRSDRDRSDRDRSDRSDRDRKDRDRERSDRGKEDSRDDKKGDEKKGEGSSEGDSKDKAIDEKRRSRSRSRDRKRKKSRSRSPPRRSDSRSRRSRRSRSRSRKRSRRSGSRGRKRSRRSPSSSSSRSRSRPPKEKKSKFDASAVTATLNAVNQLSQIGGGVNSAAVQHLLATQMQAANPQLTRQARRLYVGNLPVGMGLNEKMLTDFFNSTVTSFGVQTPNPVLSVWLSSEGTFCFVEMRSVQDCTACMTLLQGLTLAGRSLRVGRPADYKAPPPQLESYIVGLPPGSQWKPPVAPQMSNPLAMANANLANLVANPMATMQSLQQLTPAQLASLSATAGPKPPPSNSTTNPTRIVVLLNMITSKELEDDDEFNDIVSDIRDECTNFGTLQNVVIPRPKLEGKDDAGTDNGPRTGTGVGRIFVVYEDVTGSTKALSTLNGRTFNNNLVEAYYYAEDAFNARTFE